MKRREIYVNFLFKQKILLNYLAELLGRLSIMKKNRLVKRILTIAAMAVMAFQLMACGNDGAGVSSNSANAAANALVDHEYAASTVIFTVEDMDITLEDYYLFAIQYIYNYSVDPASLSTEQAIMEANENILNELKLETVEYKLALVKEVTLTDEQLETAKTTAQNFYDYFGGDAFFSNYGISREKVDELFIHQNYIQILKEMTVDLLAEDYKAEYDAQYSELTYFSLYYVLFPSIKYDGINPVMGADGQSYVALTEDEMAEQYEKACDFLAAAKEADANGEEGANMEALAQEYGVGFLSQVLRGYFGEYSEDLNSIIVNMENGEISDIIETEAGYMIIRMDNNNDEEFKDFSMTYIAQQSAETLFTTVQDNWIAGSGVANVVVNYDALNDSQIVSLSSYLYGNGMVISGGSN